MKSSSAVVVAPTFETHVDDHWRERSLVDEVRSKLTATPHSLSPRWLYDDRGSELFDRITRLDEYYPTEAERRLLTVICDDIVELSGADTIVELGSGTSDKTRTIIDAFWSAGALDRFVPFDVSQGVLREAADLLSHRYPGLLVHGVAGDFHEHLLEVDVDDLGTPMLAFLGSTIGNLDETERARFLGEVAQWLPSGGSFLLGFDLVKSLDRIVAAYNDSSGLTAEFISNLLCVLNHELGANFDPTAFQYVGMWDAANTRMDMRLRSLTSQRVDIPGAQVVVDFAKGQELHAEISTKFTVDQMCAEVEAAGLHLVRTWTQDEDDFAMLLAVRL